jgi:hypothetical protein
MYEMRGSMANRFGCVVRRRAGKIGDRFEREEVRLLRRAVVAALLDRNPHAIGKKEDAQGWHVSTSDNALVAIVLHGARTHAARLGTHTRRPLSRPLQPVPW